MQKPEKSLRRVVQRTPVAARLLEQSVGALYICADECTGVDDRPIHVALRGEVNNRPRTMLIERGSNDFRIADIAAHQSIARMLFKRCEICRIPGVCQ